MPFYEYQCEECGHEFEALQKISADPLTDCPECKKTSLRKKVSAAAFRLKGGGWYETDFKSGKKKNIAGEESKNTKESESSKTSTDKKESKKETSSKEGKKAESSSGNKKPAPKGK